MDELLLELANSVPGVYWLIVYLRLLAMSRLLTTECKSANGTLSTKSEAWLGANRVNGTPNQLDLV
jgi:hypothetical protein